MPLPTGHNASTALHVERFTDILASSGAREALAYIVGLSDYRFIGIFRFKNGRANAAIHYDRENPEVMSATEVPDTATYCCYVRDSKGIFTTVDASSDERLTQHPARETILAYCGVPILEPDGHLLGTLCHYDVVPRDTDHLDLQLLMQVAGLLEQGGHVPPYPSAT